MELPTIELLAQIKGVVMAMKMGALSYQKAKELTREDLEEYNRRASVVSRKYGKKWIPLSFTKIAR